MRQTITSVIILAYELSAKSENEAKDIVGSFVCNRFTKGNYSEKFAGRIATQPRVVQVYWPMKSFPRVYQIIELESLLYAEITSKAYVNLVS